MPEHDLGTKSRAFDAFLFFFSFMVSGIAQINQKIAALVAQYQSEQDVESKLYDTRLILEYVKRNDPSLSRKTGKLLRDGITAGISVELIQYFRSFAFSQVE